MTNFSQGDRTEPRDRASGPRRAPSGRIFNAPGVLLVIAGATIVAHALLALSPSRTARLIDFVGSVNPARVAAGLDGYGGFFGLVSPFVTHMFLHAGLAHLLFNMVWLLAFGAPVARRMKTEGAVQSGAALNAAAVFALFYLLCGAAGAALFVLLNYGQFSLLVGASGGVSGLFGALVRFGFNRATLFDSRPVGASPLLSRPVLVWSAFIVAFNNPLAVLLLSPIAGGANIAWEAHLGGYFFGLLLYPLFERIALAGR